MLIVDVFSYRVDYIRRERIGSSSGWPGDHVLKQAVFSLSASPFHIVEYFVDLRGIYPADEHRIAGWREMTGRMRARRVLGFFL